MTIKEIADRSGRSVDTISKWVHGRVSIKPRDCVIMEAITGVPASAWRLGYVDEYDSVSGVEISGVVKLSDVVRRL